MGVMSFLGKQAQKGGASELPDQFRGCVLGEKSGDDRVEACKDMVKNGAAYLGPYGRALSGGLEIADKVSEGIETVTGTSGYQYLKQGATWALDKLQRFTRGEGNEAKPLPTLPSEPSPDGGATEDDPRNDILIPGSPCTDKDTGETGRAITQREYEARCVEAQTEAAAP